MVFQDDDFETWHNELADVAPHHKREQRFQTRMVPDSEEVEELDILPVPQRQDSQSAAQKEVIQPAVMVPTGQPVAPSAPLVIYSNTADKIAGWRNGVDKKRMKQLAGGQIPFTDRLDLHGFYERQAWAATQDFLNECAQAEHRCVLIVHGKGRGYGEQLDMGIIKANMAGWLSHHPRVLAFHTAAPKDGGRGAIYVYLKRQR